jgi:hypothetical protein
VKSALFSVSLIVAVVTCPVVAPGEGTIYEPGQDTGLGFNLVSWWNPELDGQDGSALWTAAVQDAWDHGFTHVSLCPVRYFDPSTGAIAPTSAKGPELSHVAAGAARAKSLGMTVTINPFVEYEGFTNWRGVWNPSGSVAETFWTDYAQYVSAVATMSETTGADRMTIGTELRAIMRNSAHNADVSAVIDAAEAAFSGDIGYAANHDNYNNANLTTTVWENAKVDFIGVDAYFNLASNAQADASADHPDSGFIQTVENNWNNILDGQVLPFAADRKGGEGMPVILTEHGLIPWNRTTVKPYSENPKWSGQSVDVDEQVNGYDALLRSLDGRAASNELLEAYLWQWGMPGAYDSLWFLHPYAEDNAPGSKYDETLSRAAARFLNHFATSALTPGDADRNGVVDFDDAWILLDHYNTGQTELAWTDGDFNLDGVVDELDANILLAHWDPDTAPPTIPEPGTLLLLAAGALPVIRRRRAGRRRAS